MIFITHFDMTRLFITPKFVVVDDNLKHMQNSYKLLYYGNKFIASEKFHLKLSKHICKLTESLVFIFNDASNRFACKCSLFNGANNTVNNAYDKIM